MNLYEIESAIMDCVDSETGEIIDEIRLDALLMERNQKIEAVTLWIKNLESDAAAIKAERDNLYQRQKSAENKAESLRNWLANALQGQKFETPKCRVSFRKSTTTEIDETVIDKKWLIEKTTYMPDKTAIKKALQSGEEIPGAYLLEKQNIQIK